MIGRTSACVSGWSAVPRVARGFAGTDEMGMSQQRSASARQQRTVSDRGSGAGGAGWLVAVMIRDWEQEAGGHSCAL